MSHDSDRIRLLEDTLIQLEKESIALKTRVEVMQKESGLTEEALAKLLMLLWVEKKIKRAQAWGEPLRSISGSVALSPPKKITPKGIISEYLELTKQGY